MVTSVTWVADIHTKPQRPPTDGSSGPWYGLAGEGTEKKKVRVKEGREEREKERGYTTGVQDER